MTEPYATAYSDDVAFEVFVLEKGVPLLDTTQSASAEYDVANDKLVVNMMVSETLGRTLPQAMEEMGVRPLLFGSAWKCLDILLEYALDEAGLLPGRGRRWLIAEKVAQAQAGAGKAEPLSSRPTSGPASRRPTRRCTTYGMRSPIAGRISTLTATLSGQTRQEGRLPP